MRDDERKPDMRGGNVTQDILISMGAAIVVEEFIKEVGSTTMAELCDEPPRNMTPREARWGLMWLMDNGKAKLDRNLRVTIIESKT